MMVEQARMADDMFENTGIEEEDFNCAVLYHNIMHDPDVMKIQMENMRKLGLGGMGGGMGFGM